MFMLNEAIRLIMRARKEKMEILKGVQAKWEKWKADAPERKLRREELKRFAFFDSSSMYRDLSDEDKEFVNDWAKKIVDWGGTSTVWQTEKLWRTYISALDERAKRPSGIHLKSIEDARKKTGSGLYEAAVYRENLGASISYRVWLMERRKELGLPPPVE